MLDSAQIYDVTTIAISVPPIPRISLVIGLAIAAVVIGWLCVYGYAEQNKKVCEVKPCPGCPPGDVSV